ncbi:hypothetical protein [Alloacidobacterium dinghuense]|uniref:hypothetical protein n=1 Tax=Alloacidobacterium dinghuense TaxID=2763107 RepID=UPI00203764BA|nr:hypothetical protein [Alloacidobacterium dinghuense]
MTASLIPPEPPSLVRTDGGFRRYYRPRVANTLLKLNLARFDPGRVVLLGDLHTRVTEQD